MNSVTLWRMMYWQFNVHTNALVPELSVSSALAGAAVLPDSQCEEPHRHGGEGISSDLRECIFMIYNLSGRALTVLIFTTPGVKLDKMLLSFHGWK